MCQDKTPSERLEKAQQSREESPTGERKVEGPVMPCQASVTKSYHHLGFGLGFGQYPIDRREMALEVPVLNNPGVRNVEPVHAAAGNAFEGSRTTDEPRSAKKIYAPNAYPDNPSVFGAELAMGDNRLVVESGVLGYQLDGATNANLNEFLGKTLALHFSRSGVLRPTGTGNFEASYLGDQERYQNLTEMMGVKLFVYVRLELDGKMGIRELVDGKLKPDILDLNEYRKRVIIQTDQYRDAMCGSMPLIPGLYQVHVLLNSEGGGAFSLLSAYCDGDPFYGE